MKNFKKIAVLSSILMGSAMAQDSEQGLDSQPIDELNQAMYQPVDKNAADYIDQKTYGSGDYYLFYAASGATSIHDSEYSYGGAGCVYRTSGDRYFDMPLQIPDGHAIYGFRYYWYDNDNSAISNAALLKYNGEGDVETLLTVVSTDTSGYGNSYDDIQNSSGVAEPHTVNNRTGSYVIRFSSDGTDEKIKICGVRLFIDSTP